MSEIKISFNTRFAPAEELGYFPLPEERIPTRAEITKFLTQKIPMRGNLSQKETGVVPQLGKIPRYLLMCFDPLISNTSVMQNLKCSQFKITPRGKISFTVSIMNSGPDKMEIPNIIKHAFTEYNTTYGGGNPPLTVFSKHKYSNPERPKAKKYILPIGEVQIETESLVFKITKEIKKQKSS